jgi:lysophospholipase L1-like esterase
MSRLFYPALWLFFSMFVLSSPPAGAQVSGHERWWNPAENAFPVIEGQGWHEGLAHPYDRLPERAQKRVREAVWHLSGQSAGLVIRFRTGAREIQVRYTVGQGKHLGMPHMPPTGVSGVDLYAVDKNGGWQWCGGRYAFGDTITYRFTSLPADYVREYHLYLPLYNDVKWLEIGVPDTTRLTALPLSPDKPIVVYGTSIAQGACASRPGRAWTAILGRLLHRPVVNLGFSGNGQLEPSVVSFLTELDPQLYLIDCLPNMTRFPYDTVRERMIRTVRTLRQERPDVPVLIAADADGNIASLDLEKDSAYARVNRAGLSAFTELKSEGLSGIYFLPATAIGLGIESTVEGTHPNDYGMQRYAEAYEKVIRGILREPVGPYTTTRPCKQYRSKVYDWNARHAKELEMNREDPPRIVFLGNSITHYWGGEPACRIHRGADSWSQYFAPAGVRNFGFSWDRIENVLWRVYHGELDGYRAAEVMINIGTNNLSVNDNHEILAGLRLLIEAVKQRQPSARVLVIGIYPRKDGEARVAVLNGGLARLCGQENVHYCDPGTHLLDASGKIIPSLFADGSLHPNAAGYRILAKALQPYLQPR